MKIFIIFFCIVYSYGININNTIEVDNDFFLSELVKDYNFRIKQNILTEFKKSSKLEKFKMIDNLEIKKLRDFKYELIPEETLNLLNDYQKLKLKNYIKFREEEDITEVIDITNFLPETKYIKTQNNLFLTLEKLDNYNFFKYSHQYFDIRELKDKNNSVFKSNIDDEKNWYFDVKYKNLNIEKLNIGFFNIINYLKIGELSYIDKSNIEEISNNREEISNILLNKKSYFERELNDFTNENIPQNKYEALGIREGIDLINNYSFSIFKNIRMLKINNLEFSNIIDKELKINIEKLEIDNLEHIIKLFFKKDLETFKTKKEDEFFTTNIKIKNPNIKFNRVINSKTNFYEDFINENIFNFNLKEHLLEENNDIIRFIRKDKNTIKDLNLDFYLDIRFIENKNDVNYNYLHFRIRDLTISIDKVGTIDINFEFFYPISSFKYLTTKNLFEDIILKNIDIKFNLYELLINKENYYKYNRNESLHDTAYKKYNWEYNFEKEFNRKIEEKYLNFYENYSFLLKSIPKDVYFNFFKMNYQYLNLNIFNKKALRLEELLTRIKVHKENNTFLTDELDFKYDVILDRKILEKR